MRGACVHTWTSQRPSRRERTPNAAPASKRPHPARYARRRLACLPQAYRGLKQHFGKAVVVTERNCSARERCDFRDCESLRYSLIDLMNLARTRLILGSGYSSYSEVAARMGGTGLPSSHGLPILMAGRDFGSERLPLPPEARPLKRSRATPTGRRGAAFFELS